MYDYGLIGNCQTSALISNHGTLKWLCFPRPDSPPVFGQLLDENGGHFSVCSSDNISGHQNYIINTNVLETLITTSDGSQYRITDFCPRFEQYGRIYRPASVFRKIEPVKGNPIIRISCHPVSGWEKEAIETIRGNSHVRYNIRGEQMRITMNMPITYFLEETSFSLKETLYFAITWGTGLEDDLVEVSRQFLTKTIQYWQTWVKHCSIPTKFQKETIRSALVLKMHCYEDTGAILAALTTSLPEELHRERNWDYRYCWLRDAAFVLTAFHNLGHFEEMEGFLKFLLNIAENHNPNHGGLRPVYTLDQKLPLPEMVHENWSGYLNSRPVRSHNQAAEHQQNDVYGELLLSLVPIFLDERFQHLRNKEHEVLIEKLILLCIQNISKPDAGLWEFRDGWQEHSFSNLMCWAGIERAITLKSLGFLKSISEDKLKEALSRAEKAIYSAVVSGSLRNGPKDESFDASLLLLPLLRFPDLELNQKTVTEISEKLMLPSQESEGFLFRYKRKDDFGTPSSAFLICSFWLVQSLTQIGQKEKALKLLNELTHSANKLGLYSEHFLPDVNIQVGNFPQAYSHVGLINAAFAVSPPWRDIL